MKLAELTIKKRGREMKALCPECSHARKKSSDPCLSINNNTGLYHCHHCGVSGILDDFKPDIKMPDNYEPIHPKSVTLTGQHFEYLHSRGITMEVAQRNGITTSKKNPDYIAFNYYEGDQIVNVKYRHASKKKFMQSPGGKPVFYGVNDIDADMLIITEGEFDKLSFEVAGYRSCVSVPMGAPNETDQNVDGKLKCLLLSEDKVQQVKRVIIASDNDVNGRRLTEELARRIGVEKCYKVEYPEGCKDGNDVLLTYGVEALQRVVEQAQPFPIEGVSRVRDFKQDVVDIYDNGYPDGLTVGYTEFDELFKFMYGYLITVTGIPTHGKSNYVEQMSIKLAAHHGLKFGVFSPEHYPPAHFIQRLVRLYIGKPMFGPAKMTPDQLSAGIDFVDRHFYIIHGDDDHTLDNILTSAKQLVYREGIRALIIDPWTDIEHQIGRGDNETRYTAQCLAKIKKFNRLHGVSTFLIAHPTKMRKNEDGTYAVPTMYDISGSANFYNKSDFGLTVYRDENDFSQVHVQKVKFEGIMGQKGSATFRYDKSSNRYYEMGVNAHGVEQPSKLKKIDYEQESDLPF